MDELSLTLKQLPETLLLILDPVIAVASEARDGYQAKDIRSALAPVVELATERNIAVLGITHYLKRHSTLASDPLDWVIGSRAWDAVARMVLAVDDTPAGRVPMRAKSNLGPTRGGYSYTWEEKAVKKEGVKGLAIRFVESVEARISFLKTQLQPSANLERQY